MSMPDEQRKIQRELERVVEGVLDEITRNGEWSSRDTEIIVDAALDMAGKMKKS